MHINDFPNEILFSILEAAASLNEKDGVAYTFGLSQPPASPYSAKPQRYIRGPVPPALMKMDTTASIRAVCGHWHDWSVSYALRDVYVRHWRGSERWLDLSLQRGTPLSSEHELFAPKKKLGTHFGIAGQFRFGSVFGFST